MAQNLAVEQELVKQFINMTRLVVPSPIINLPNSLIEVIRQWSSTALYANYGIADLTNVMLFRSDVVDYLDGISNPVALRFCCHGQGSGTTPAGVLDYPVYDDAIYSHSWFLDTFQTGVTYDEVTYKLGTSSLYFSGEGISYGTPPSSTWIAIGTSDWQFRGFFRFETLPTTSPMGLLQIQDGPNLGISVTADGLRVNYSIDAVNIIAVNSTTVTWATDTWYYISIRRTGNTLYFFVDNTAYGTADWTGVSIVIPQQNTFYLGADFTPGTISFNGWLNEVELFIGSTTTDEEPVETRTTAFIPAISWVSKPMYIQSSATELDVLIFQDKITFAPFGVPDIDLSTSTFAISLNNGTTFTPVTLHIANNLATNSTTYRGSLDLTGITNTNQLVYRITSAEGVVLTINGVCIYWQDGTDATHSTVTNFWNYSNTELSTVPIATSSLVDKLKAVYQYLFNKKTVTATTETLYKANGSTVLATSSITDDNTTVTKTKLE